MSRQQLRQRGFTIIEVVLVLAIAALIFLMVFIALPALQRNQRDQARKEVLGKVTSAVTTYQSNKRGLNPTTGALLQGYVDGAAISGDSTKAEHGGYTAGTDDTYIDNNYILTVTSSVPADGIGNADTNVIQVVSGAKCDASGTKAVSGSTRNAAVIMVMENGLTKDSTGATVLGNSSICQSI
jgi:prepilin-type N-terminal cleavage/methylation domain-containing protein